MSWKQQLHSWFKVSNINIYKCVLTTAATQHNFLLQNHFNQRATYCKTLLFSLLFLLCFFPPLQHLHFLMRITLDHNFCNTNKNTEKKQTRSAAGANLCYVHVLLKKKVQPDKSHNVHNKHLHLHTQRPDNYIRSKSAQFPQHSFRKVSLRALSFHPPLLTNSIWLTNRDA